MGGMGGVGGGGDSTPALEKLEDNANIWFSGHRWRYV